MANRLESLLRRAQKHGCSNCGDRVLSLYTVELNFFPGQLLQKRHKERVQGEIYCSECYDGLAKLPIHVDGEPNAVPIGNATDLSEMHCHICQNECMSSFPSEVIGIIAQTHWEGMKPMGGSALAVFCTECVESRRITLLEKIK